MPRNPSELARLEEEFQEAKTIFHDLRRPKGVREEAGREMRRLAALLQYGPLPKYNGK